MQGFVCGTKLLRMELADDDKSSDTAGTCVHGADLYAARRNLKHPLPVKSKSTDKHPAVN
jgi:hypothetical protein